MAARTSYHNIWMMNQAASKGVVILLTQGFLSSACPVSPEGGTDTREKTFGAKQYFKNDFWAGFL